MSKIPDKNLCSVANEILSSFGALFKHVLKNLQNTVSAQLTNKVTNKNLPESKFCSVLWLNYTALSIHTRYLHALNSVYGTISCEGASPSKWPMRTEGIPPSSSCSFLHTQLHIHTVSSALTQLRQLSLTHYTDSQVT